MGHCYYYRGSNTCKYKTQKDDNISLEHHVVLSNQRTVGEEGQCQVCNPHPGLSSPPGRVTTSPSSGSESAADPEPQAAHTPSWGGGGHPWTPGRHTLSSLKPPSFTRGIIRGLIPKAHLPKSILPTAWLCLSVAQSKHCTQSGHLVYLFNLSRTHTHIHLHICVHLFEKIPI